MRTFAIECCKSGFSWWAWPKVSRSSKFGRVHISKAVRTSAETRIISFINVDISHRIWQYCEYFTPWSLPKFSRPAIWNVHVSKTASASTEMRNDDIYMCEYLPSKVAILNVVLSELDLYIRGCCCDFVVHLLWKTAQTVDIPCRYLLDSWGHAVDCVELLFFEFVSRRRRGTSVAALIKMAANI